MGAVPAKPPIMPSESGRHFEGGPSAEILPFASGGTTGPDDTEVRSGTYEGPVLSFGWGPPERKKPSPPTDKKPTKRRGEIKQSPERTKRVVEKARGFLGELRSR